MPDDDDDNDDHRQPPLPAPHPSPANNTGRAADQLPVVQTTPVRRWLTLAERETLRQRLQKRFH
ncbi:MAG: hypothetical protein P4M09_03010 [Devosia sp.]|nr:hypothetical protein [Devosia sp.]